MLNDLILFDGIEIGVSLNVSCVTSCFEASNLP